MRNERTTKADKRERRKTHDKLAQLEAAHLAATQMRRPPDEYLSSAPPRLGHPLHPPNTTYKSRATSGKWEGERAEGEPLNRFAAARFFLLAVFLSSFHDLSRFSLLLGIACSRLGWSGISFSASKQRASGQRDDIHDRSQGAVWSPDFWDFDIADIPTVISSEGDDFEYADDCGLWYEIDDDNRDVIVSIINIDLQSLVMWGQGNLTTFEPDKTTYTIISRKRDPFDPFERSAGIMMGGAQVKRVDEVKLVGFLFDTKLTFSSMIDKLAKKARCRLGALRRLKPMLDKSNLKQMYTMFIRSILEYGSLVYMGAAKSHLDKLDRVQESAMKLCGFEIESLESRREAAAIGLALDLLDGKGYGELQDHVSTLIEPLKLAKKRTRQNVDAGTQLKPKTKTSSLDSFKSSYLGSIHKIWSRLPQSLVREGLSSNWSKIKSRAKKFCIGKWSPAEKTTRPQRKKIKKNENYSSKLNNELNAHTDWDAIRKDLKDQGISINKIGHL